jgi:hypothetical protein
MRSALQVYLRWKLGPEKAARLTDWLDTRHIFKTPDFLKESEVEKLFKGCKTAHERFLIAVLFDAGARATEFHNIRYEDIQMPEGVNAHVRITLKEEYSKTKGRMVGLYWKHSLDAVRDFLREREATGIKASDPVYDGLYDATRMFLHRLGNKVLGRPIHYHLFRHSSATYYAAKMNRQQLCIRYGWTFSSRMPDVYIARAGVDMQELDERFKATEVDTLKTTITTLEQKNHLNDDRITRLEADKNVLEDNLAALAEIIRRLPPVSEIESRVRKLSARVPANLPAESSGRA